MMQKIQALLVDDHPLFRQGFVAAVCQKLPQIEFAVAGSVAQALQILPRLSPALILADWRLPDGDGLSLLTEMGRLCPSSARVLLSGADDARLPEKARDAGLLGYIPKTLDAELLALAMQRILNGERYFPDGPQSRASALLTSRQQGIMVLLSQGKTNKEIARCCAITERTVKDHVSLIFDRLGAVNRADAITRAIARGLI